MKISLNWENHENPLNWENHENFAWFVCLQKLKFFLIRLTFSKVFIDWLSSLLNRDQKKCFSTLREKTMKISLNWENHEIPLNWENHENFAWLVWLQKLRFFLIRLTFSKVFIEWLSSLLNRDKKKCFSTLRERTMKIFLNWENHENPLNWENHEIPLNWENHENFAWLVWLQKLKFFLTRIWVCT